MTNSVDSVQLKREATLKFLIGVRLGVFALFIAFDALVVFSQVPQTEFGIAGMGFFSMIVTLRVTGLPLTGAGKIFRYCLGSWGGAAIIGLVAAAIDNMTGLYERPTLIGSYVSYVVPVFICAGVGEFFILRIAKAHEAGRKNAAIIWWERFSQSKIVNGIALVILLSASTYFIYLIISKG
jgi:hypothetical protein